MNQPLAKLNFWREVAPIIWNRCFPTFHLKAAVTLKPVEGTMYKRLFKIGGARTAGVIPDSCYCSQQSMTLIVKG